ncbi:MULTISPECIES: hypothetical protein [Bacteria]|uniref:hypothetical protein n=1 Tax=Bacteria TaxID=2 RepID=UPI002E7B111C|nr:hypothetical protein [Cetobacterium somerae]WVJ03147.1 hypothetical protein VSU16_14580 [Cetobacterium somerae]
MKRNNSKEISLNLIHSSRRSGKSHNLVNEALTYAIKNKKNKISIITVNRENIADIICCNFYVDEVIKKSLSHLKLKTKIGIIDVAILSFESALRPRRNFGEKIYFDEFAIERNLKASLKLLNILSNNNVKEIDCYFTSLIPNLNKTLFDLVIYYIKNGRHINELKKQLLHHYKKEEIENHWNILADSVYVTTNSNITIKEEYINTINTKLNTVTSYMDLFSLEQTIFNSFISKDLYGFFFENKPLYKRLNSYACSRMNKIKEKLKETNSSQKS